MKIAIVNGPNLNMLGKREPELYGTQSFEDYLALLRLAYPSVAICYYQSNVEGEIVDILQDCLAQNVVGIIINPAAYTHTSIAIADALAAVAIPAVEVHISNVLAREDYRKTSFVAAQCVGSISGLGLMGYKLAIEFLIDNER